MFTCNLPKDNSGPKRWYNGKKEIVKERGRERGGGGVGGGERSRMDVARQKMVCAKGDMGLCV